MLHGAITKESNNSVSKPEKFKQELWKTCQTQSQNRSVMPVMGVLTRGSWQINWKLSHFFRKNLTNYFCLWVFVKVLKLPKRGRNMIWETLGLRPENWNSEPYVRSWFSSKSSVKMKIFWKNSNLFLHSGHQCASPPAGGSNLKCPQLFFARRIYMKLFCQSHIILIIAWSCFKWDWPTLYIGIFLE